jgi:hypothetical protein
MTDGKEEEKEKDKALHIGSGHGVGKPLPPRTIAAQSQAWNSAARIIILGAALLGLLILAGIALFIRSENVRDLLWAIVALIAYLAGSTEAARKEEK